MKQAPLLRMDSIIKTFPGVKALQGVSLSVAHGEVHALLGENGAGKSTLMKILAGAYRKSGGTIVLEGETVDIRNPEHARDLGIAIVYQELSILPHLSVAENIFLGRLPRRRGLSWLVDWRACYAQCRELLDRIGLDLDPRTRGSSLKVAEQQLLEIAKAISNNAKLVVMDEPTTSLTPREARALFTIVNSLREQGVSIIYISHRLVEVKELCDRATVMRDGRLVGTVDVRDTEIKTWVSMMVGRPLDQLFPKQAVTRGAETLRVSNLSTNKLKGVSFSAYKGEILGIAGLVGSGRTELARAIFGADPIVSGTVTIEGKSVAIKSPREAIRHGLALVPEDRKQQGAILPMSVKENITLANLRGVSHAGQINPVQEGRTAADYVRSMRIVTPGVNQRFVNLSGGNQQKVVIAKWLFSDSRVLIIDEPTRGIDVGAKAEIYTLLQKLVADQNTILMISSELPELIGMSDRILVMHEGRLAGELGPHDFTEEKILTIASGLVKQEPAALQEVAPALTPAALPTPDGFLPVTSRRASLP